jgi:hypothetical protein
VTPGVKGSFIVPWPGQWNSPSLPSSKRIVKK